MISDGIESVVQIWLDRLKSRDNLSPSTIRTYASIMRQLTAWAGGKGVLYLDGDRLGQWLDHLAAEGKDPGTRRIYIGAASQFYLWALRQRLIDEDPTLDLPRPRSRRRLPRGVLEDEMAMLLQVTSDPVMRVIIGLGGLAGLRAGEVARLDWRDIILDDGGHPRMTVMGKGGKERTIIVSPELRELLEALPHRRGPVVPRLDGRPGPNASWTISHRGGDHMRSHGVERTYHALRHRFCTIAYAETRDLRAVQEAAGHQDPSSTVIYTRVAGDSVVEAFMRAGRVQGRRAAPHVHPHRHRHAKGHKSA